MRAILRLKPHLKVGNISSDKMAVDPSPPPESDLRDLKCL